MELQNIPYEQRFDVDRSWGWGEANKYFTAESAVHIVLRRIVGRLKDAGVPYAVGGDLAMCAHGYRRFTTRIVVFIDREAHSRLQSEVLASGFVACSSRVLSVRDTEFGVLISLCRAGDSASNREVTPILYPTPADASISIGGIDYLRIEKLIELKLATGISSKTRIGDLADVGELIKRLQLPQSTRASLHPSVHAEFVRLWEDYFNAPDEPPQWQEAWEKYLDQQESAKKPKSLHA